MKIKNIISTVLVASSVALLSFCLLPLQAHAAQFESGDKINITSVKENVYAAGDTVNINTSVSKDLTVAGSEVTVQGSVENTANIAGGTVNINVKSVGNNLRVAGGTVNISGSIGQDLVVAGGDVTIENANISGDLVVSASNITLKNVVVNGDLNGRYSKYDGEDPKSFVQGKVDFSQAENKSDQAKPLAEAMGFGLAYLLHGQLAVLVVTLVLASYLNKRKRLAISSISFNKSFWLDALIALGVVLLLPIVFVISAVIALIPFFGAISFFPIIGTLSGLLVMLFFLSQLFFPIYLGNLIKNVFNVTTPIYTLVLLSFVLLFVSNILLPVPILGMLLGFVLGLFGLVNFGFVIRKIVAALKLYVASREK